MKPLSRITERFSESVIREMTRLSDEHDGINLSQGFPDFDAPEVLKSAAADAVMAGHNQYPITFGEPELRDAIAQKAARFNGIEADPRTDVTVTCGATEAMIATMKAVINPGDEVVIFEPFYENYGPDGILSGATPRYVRLHRPDWTFDEDELSASFNPKTKAIVINTPNNPTGRVFTERELRVIADLCTDHDVLAITDEIYEHIVYDGRKHLSLGAFPDMSDRTVTINSLSKTYSVTGWRVGWAIAPRQVSERIRKVHDFLTVGAPTPLQHAAVVALGLPDAYYQSLAQRYDAARTQLFDALIACGIHPTRPEGAYYMMADAAMLRERMGIGPNTNLAVELLKRAGVATVPGTSFYATPTAGDDLVRFCFCKEPATLEAAAERLRTRLPLLEEA